ncbi:MAG: hypothetical protein EBS05_20625, partial [Proteobacteria bacterium]|nr:hypothetical protein [Pseudomonadota bacterium]
KTPHADPGGKMPALYGRQDARRYSACRVAIVLGSIPCSSKDAESVASEVGPVAAGVPPGGTRHPATEHSRIIPSRKTPHADPGGKMPALYGRQDARC